MKKIVSCVMLALILISTLTLALNIQPAKAGWTGTVYIRADGSIDPPDAPLITYDNVTYTLTGNIASSADGIIVERDNIVIDGVSYALNGTGASPYKGIILSERSNVTVRNLSIRNFWHGIWLKNSHLITISGNNIADIYWSAIIVFYSSNVCIWRNNITRSGSTGIYLISSSENNILKNNITKGGYGILLQDSSNNKITDNLLHNNSPWGIFLAGDSRSNNVISNNVTAIQYGIEVRGSKNFVRGNFVKNNMWGIIIASSYSNIVANHITTNDYGIWLCSSNNSIIENNITNNGYGIYIFSVYPSNNNMICHNNFENNTKQVYDFSWDHPDYSPSINIWDYSYPLGGNYWSDYTGVDFYSGPYQNETGSDFIGDTPYIIDANNVDHYPLMFPYGAPPPKVDLSISSLDISFSDHNPFDGQTITVTANVRNNGEESAENVIVKFFDGNVTIGEKTIPLLAPESNGTAYICWTARGEGFHLIKVVVDPYNAIIEPDECNNEATRSILVGKLPFIGGIIVQASVMPDTTLAGSTVTVKGSAIYNTTYGAGEPVAGAEVNIAIADWVQVKTYTLRDGTFEAKVTAPYTPGYYTIVVTVTDFTFNERVELGLNVTQVEGIDLTISLSDISFSPPDPVEGQHVSITATIHNIGTQDATNALVAFYDGDKLIGNGTIDTVTAGGASSLSLLWDATPWGWHTIKVVIDPENTITEVNENNNQASRGIYVYPPLPDLTPTSIGFSDNTPAVNQIITISANIKNIGGVSTSNVLVSFLIDGQLIENVTITQINGKGESKIASIIYSFTTAGWHKVCVVADPDNSIVEADENNNRLCLDIYVHPPLPDLTPSITLSNDSPNLGDIVTVYATVYNIGEVEAQNVTVSIYDDDVRIGYATITSLNAGAHETIQVLWNATPAGWHRIRVAVDENNTIEEIDENNNVAVRYVYVSPPQASDLCIHCEDITFSKLVAEEGEEVTIYATIHNIGAVDAQSVTVTFYVDDVQLGFPKTISVIPVSGSETVSTKWTASGAGSHVVKVMADAPMEANKTNNVATRAIIVGEHNVAVTSVTPTKNVVLPGEILSINVTATNKGNFIETFNLTLYANTTAIQTITLTLESGNSTTITISWDTSGYAIGNYTIWAYIEPVPRETNTEDNTYVDGTVQILQPLSVSITPSTAEIKVGESVTFTSTVSGGLSPYSYQWYVNGTAVEGATSQTWIFAPTTPGTYIMHLNVTDSTPQTAKSDTATITVAPQLMVSISPTSASILVRQSITFTSTVSGGYTPYTHQWYLNGNPVSGATSASWTFTPTTIGIYYIYLKVTDDKGNTAQSETARITVVTVPVGGYSVPIQLPTTAKPATVQIVLLTILTAIFITIKRKTKRKH
ncbi:MAG: CARDB domain-containing protein [Candidatus Bathyarchaeia archaeon]